MSVTVYLPSRDGNGKILEMRSQGTDTFRRDAKIKDLRAHFVRFYTFGTFESPELRVDWIADEFGVSRWYEETRAPVHVVSATQIVTPDGQHVLSMCGEDMGPYSEVARIHPVGNYLWSASPHWQRVTCQGCASRREA